MDSRYAAVTSDLRRSYDGAVEERSSSPLQRWKDVEQRGFLDLLVAEGRQTLLEIGAGTGRHGAFFAAAGLDVVCTDLSPEMVAHCAAIGLEAHCRDFLDLDLGRTFDAVFAMNCTLHVPVEVLPDVLRSVRSTLVPGGVFYLGQYGGIRLDGPFEDDTYEPKRYFSWLPDDELMAIAAEVFDVESFRAVDVSDVPDGAHFQALLLRA